MQQMLKIQHWWLIFGSGASLSAAPATIGPKSE